MERAAEVPVPGAVIRHWPILRRDTEYANNSLSTG